jgi:hypothetical protein
VHVKELLPSLHLPPLRHGLRAQSSSLISQYWPRNPETQLQKNDPTKELFFTHFPPLMHGVVGEVQLKAASMHHGANTMKTRSNRCDTEQHNIMATIRP